MNGVGYATDGESCRFFIAWGAAGKTGAVSWNVLSPLLFRT